MHINKNFAQIYKKKKKKLFSILKINIIINKEDATQYSGEN